MSMPDPGFRWNVLDYGGGTREEIDYKRLTTMAGNVFSRPLSTGARCAGVRAAWHCLWQRFPSQDLARALNAFLAGSDAESANWRAAMEVAFCGLLRGAEFALQVERELRHGCLSLW